VCLTSAARPNTHPHPPHNTPHPPGLFNFGELDIIKREEIKFNEERK